MSSGPGASGPLVSGVGAPGRGIEGPGSAGWDGALPGFEGLLPRQAISRSEWPVTGLGGRIRPG